MNLAPLSGNRYDATVRARSASEGFDSDSAAQLDSSPTAATPARQATRNCTYPHSPPHSPSPFSRTMEARHATCAAVTYVLSPEADMNTESLCDKAIQRVDLALSLIHI